MLSYIRNFVYILIQVYLMRIIDSDLISYDFDQLLMLEMYVIVYLHQVLVEDK